MYFLLSITTGPGPGYILCHVINCEIVPVAISHIESINIDGRWYQTFCLTCAASKMHWVRLGILIPPVN